MILKFFEQVIKTGPYTGKKYSTRFWEQVEKTESCWNWKGKLYKNGYGNFAIVGKNFLAHRIAYLLANKTLPFKPLVICHSCDNRRCVNPKHLFAGSQSDNVQDMVKKGRGNWKYGEESSKSKLTKKEVELIRILYSKGVKQSRLAKRFNVSYKQINMIVNYKQWKNDLTLNEYQSFVKRFAVYKNVGNNLAYPTLGLTGEAGEVAEKIKKIERDNLELTPKLKVDIVNELGDVLFYIATLANELEYSLEEVALLNDNKLRSRLLRNKLHGDGDNR